MRNDLIADLAPTGTLRAALNLGNPVLVQGTPATPAGVTVDIAHEIARRLGVPVEFRCFGAARESFQAAAAREADICFLAVEPARAAEVAFTAPYVVIEGTYLVRADSPLRAIEDVDRDGVRIGVNKNSAYDLYLTRTLKHATLMRSDDGIAQFVNDKLDAAAGVKQPLVAFASKNPGVRVLDGRFMEIRQAMGTAKGKTAGAAYLRDYIEEMKTSGFVADALKRSGQGEATVAPPG
jgi:polar amino acid transport system substrate-binding protein